MLALGDVERVLGQYTDFIVPAMLQARYHLTLVKGGPDYPHLAEQSHFTHIVNGVFGLAGLVEFMVSEGALVPQLNEDMLRKALALYTVHEVHKDPEVGLLGPSEFSIPLHRLQAEYRRLGLERLVALDEHLMRAANVHKRSPKHGDLLLSDDTSASRLWLLVRVADVLASARTPAEAVASLRGYLSDLAPVFAASNPPGRYALYYHELKDVRGLLTNTIHQEVGKTLADVGLCPLLYFATGTVYLGPIDLAAPGRDDLIQAATSGVLGSLSQGGGTDAIRDGLRREKSDFECYLYAFAGVRDLLQVVRDETLASKPDARLCVSEIEKEAAKRAKDGPAWRATVEERFGLRLADGEEDKAFNELWWQARRYLLYVDTLVRDLNLSEPRLDWFLRTFAVPKTVGENLRREADVWARGGLGKYALVIAYHFLRGPEFAERPAVELPPEEVLERLHERVLAGMQTIDTKLGRQVAVQTLGLRQDLEVYLHERLTVSFIPGNELADDTLGSYARRKGKGHVGRTCSICNRSSDHADGLRTGILDDFGRVFSNRVLPAREAPQGNRLWCPICQLEFILRKMVGMGLPARAHYKNSRRMYLYVLPTFSFTPGHLRLFEPLLRSFQQVTSFPVRDYGSDLGLPRYWLERRSFDPEWIERLQEVLGREAAKIAGWGGPNFVGERTSLGRARAQPHYYLITWEKTASDTETNDSRIATHTEAWAKALFAAAVISGLTGCKIYVSERPYLPVADPSELMATITLDAPHPAIQVLLGGRSSSVSLSGRERGGRSGLERVLDLSASVWMVTSEVRASGRQTKDKHVAARLATMRVSPLAGATFYREHGRLSDGQSPYATLATACAVLLEVLAEKEGGGLMDLVEKLARKCLEIALPSGAGGRGKARRYELVFREGVDAMRRAQRALPEMRQAAITGGRPCPESAAELKKLAAGNLLKGLERRKQTRRGDLLVRPWGEELGRLAGELVDIIVDDLYLGRAGGSFAAFLRIENTIADGIYYYTDRNLSQLWAEYKQQRAAQAAGNRGDKGGAI